MLDSIIAQRHYRVHRRGKKFLFCPLWEIWQATNLPSDVSISLSKISEHSTSSDARNFKEAPKCSSSKALTFQPSYVVKSWENDYVSKPLYNHLIILIKKGWFLIWHTPLSPNVNQHLHLYFWKICVTPLNLIDLPEGKDPQELQKGDYVIPSGPTHFSLCSLNSYQEYQSKNESVRKITLLRRNERWRALALLTTPPRSIPSLCHYFSPNVPPFPQLVSAVLTTKMVTYRSQIVDLLVGVSNKDQLRSSRAKAPGETTRWQRNSPPSNFDSLNHLDPDMKGNREYQTRNKETR